MVAEGFVENTKMKCVSWKKVCPNQSQQMEEMKGRGRQKGTELRTSSKCELKRFEMSLLMYVRCTILGTVMF